MNPKIETLITQHKLTLECSGPVGKVGDNDWPCIAYTYTLAKAGKQVYSGTYSLGVGHVDPKDYPMTHPGSTVDEDCLLHAWRNNRYANFKDKQLWANTAAKLAKRQQVAPALPDVLHSLLLGGSAHFDSATFEQWASDLGYDPDSRKAERIFNECVDIGRALARAFKPAELTELREAFADY